MMAADPQQPQSPADRLDSLAARVGEHADQLELLGLTVAGHDERLTELRATLDSLLPGNAGQGHTPIPSPRWHDLEGQARADAMGRLRDWVRRVYVPVYGHLAAGMAACWPEHPLALQILDHLSETWAVLYARPTRPQRVLTAQLEFQLRYVPAAAEMLQRETSDCEHQARAPLSARARPGGGRHG
jgi:hypothetical protein